MEIDIMLETRPDLDDPVSCWHWLNDHPAFFYRGKVGDRYRSQAFKEALDIELVLVDPASDTIKDDAVHNTKAQVWLECGPFLDPDEMDSEVPRFVDFGVPSHDPNLDCGADNFELAITELARLVLEHYGSYVEERMCSHCYRWAQAGPTDSDSHWYCSPACESHGPVDFLLDDGGRYIPPREQFGCEHWVGR